MICDITLGVAEQLYNRIEKEYGCAPQLIKKGDSIGFNVGGREAGRVEQVSLKDIRSTFYSPYGQAFLPVFS